MTDHILDTATSTLSEGPICDHCMGRLFANLSTGLTNDQRGAAVKLALVLDADQKYKDSSDDSLLKLLAPSSVHARKSLKIEDIQKKCWVCNALFEELDTWAKKVVKAVEGFEFNTFVVGTKPSGLLIENEEILWATSRTRWAEQLKTEMNREVGKRVEALLGKNASMKLPEITAILNITQGTVDLEVRSLFIFGRYRKIIRGIPQTRWPCRECGGSGCERCDFTGRMYPESVDELIRPEVMAATGAIDTVFHGAGREDIDALMLGKGRPFVVEAVQPIRRRIDLTRLQHKVNRHADGKIEVLGLKFVTRSAVEAIKQAKADKVYRIGVTFRAQVSEEKLISALDILSKNSIIQRTPTRVAHRRADLDRERRVHHIELEQLSPDGQSALIKVDCQGGLYVKELVSGDEGRTRPNLSELLGVESKVAELDVIEVKGIFI
ncbi:MAG TPA: tRNA pseudouridine(54/55) synthase Pus10 [Candidatus Nanoarchaeia archaeon]|nr:tRNA pseudouridine(54/55) synthase Pus10 [Candidatus Nanoarchaeia archaeon]